MSTQPGRTSRKYQETWQDYLRHVANACFVGSYVCLSNGALVTGSVFTLVGESLLAPSALKQKSWSTMIVGGIFLTLAVSTIARVTMGA